MRETLAVLQTFVDNLPEGVIVLDEKGNVIVYNDEALRLLETSVEELLLHPLTENAFAEEIKQAMNSTGTFRQSHLIIKTASRTLNCSIKTVSALLKEGKQSIITIFDATFLNRIEELKKEFISTILQKIRAPVATLKTTFSVLDELLCKSSGNDVNEVIQMARHEVDRLNILINSLRDVFTIETGLVKNDLTIEQFTVSSACEKAIQKLIPVHPEPYDRIKIEGELQCVISADFQRFCRILELVIDNALNYSNDIINVTIRSHQQYCLIKIRDFGIGVREESIPLLFTKYFREDNQITRKVQGNGLGLFISRAWVESMGGSISCESVYDEGTTITIMIPVSERLSNEQ
ncbi:MAG TPA: PAS domain-containing sensor histidine kinase [Chitinispirillaceae bacterium]|nr:PAS domain-containing sensor histidine kinase [Chitinispirillaceae bacterium]